MGTEFWLIFGFGIVTSATVALAAVGVTLQIAITNYPNIAYGSYMALGAYVSWELNVRLHLNLWLAFVISSVILAVFAWLVHLFLLNPMVGKNRGAVYMIVFTLGLWMVLEFGMAAIWGTGIKRFDTPSQIARDIGPFLLTDDQLIIIGLSVVVLTAVHLLLRLTKIGKAMRAVSDNRDLAAACGIAADTIAAITWALSGALLGLAGNVLALNITTFQPFFGDSYLFVVVSAVILGGAGHVYGAMLAAVVVGMVSELSTLYVNSAFKLETVFVVFLILVVLRPQGLIRSRARVVEG